MAGKPRTTRVGGDNTRSSPPSRAPRPVASSPHIRRLDVQLSYEVLSYITDEDVKFVDIRFCDLPGVMQHFNVPAESVDEDFFTVGQMFDGSSIRGFQAIHESDMSSCRTRRPRSSTPTAPRRRWS